MLTTVLLFLGFVILLTAEFFLPTGGLLGVVSGVLLISANMNAFSYSRIFGFSTLGASLFVTPLMLGFLVQIWPHTPIGRRILNLRPGKRERRVTNHLTRDGGPLDGLIGKRGVAKTELLPSGLVVIEDHKYDAISYGEPIEQGSKVAVASITAGKIHVRLVTEDEGQQPGHVSSDGVQSPAALELPLDSLDID